MKRRLTPSATALLVVVILAGLGSCDLLGLLKGSDPGVDVKDRLGLFMDDLNKADRTGIHEHFAGAQDYESLADTAVIDGFFPVDYRTYTLGDIEPTDGASTSTVTTTFAHSGTGAVIEDPIRFDLVKRDGNWFINKIYYPYVAGENPIIQRIVP